MVALEIVHRMVINTRNLKDGTMLNKKVDYALLSTLTLISLLILIVGCNHSVKENVTKNKTKPPNILWLVAEDLGPYIPAFGDSTIQTPNLSRLASEGVMYNQVFSVSGVCSPSRAALVSGMYPNHIGAQNMQIGNVPRERAKDPKTIAFLKQYMPVDLKPYEVVPPPFVKMHSEYLREAGYYCTNNVKEDYQFRSSPFSWNESSATAHWRNRKEGQPFFSIFNFMVTHESRIWLKANDSLWVDKDLEVPIPPYLPDTEVAKQDIRRMYSNILEMDYKVGHLLDQLEEDGELEHTIIFWYTDHGGPLPRQKRLLYDSGLKVPLIIRFPEKKSAGAIDNQLISFVDFLPTLLSLANIKPPNYLDGRAFLGSFKSSEERQYIHASADRFDEHKDMIRAVRNKRFKYLRNFMPDRDYYLPLNFREQMPIMQELLRLKDEGKLNDIQNLWFRNSKPTEELFDCESDPHELKNLANDPQYNAVLEELREECNRWMKNIDDKGFIDEQILVQEYWPSGVQPISEVPTIYEVKNGLAIRTEEIGSAIGYQVVNFGEGLSTEWNYYIGPIHLEKNQELHAIAHRKGYMPSDMVTFKL